MNWLEHFRKEEHPFIERALDWLEIVENRHATKLTDFLDPRQVYIMQTLLPKFVHVKMTLSGGVTGAERCRVLLHQEYYEPERHELGIAAFEIGGTQSAFKKLKHRDFLGALIGTGLKRDKFGDIQIYNDRAHLVVADEIADYLLSQLTQVHQVPVILETIDVSELSPVAQQWKTLNITVSSPRVDTVASEVFRLSRSKILNPIRAGLLKVNWMTVDSPSFLVRDGDVISLRGFGRFRIWKEAGTTRKGNIRLEVGVLL